MQDYVTKEQVTIPVKLEVQLTTTMQASILEMLHSIYERWRISGPPKDWEWDHEGAPFSINYLGSTLHYIEGMIVTTRDTHSGGRNV